ncbi:fibrinogen alpha chain-like [Rhinoderma darwinii]|uniref:fibrinogen alpha chain-like n=1 Tax=Rhinoderma darwinii TaxID=43563 RepID=UPI003F6649F2
MINKHNGKAQRSDSDSPYWQVSKCPNGCRVKGLITKTEKEIFSRVDSAKQSWVTSNSHNIKILSELKHLHEVADRNILTEKETLKNFAQLGNELRKKLTNLKKKVNEQVTKIRHLYSETEDQLSIMKTMEVDIDIKIRTCKGSCQNAEVFMTNLENYGAWMKDLDTIRNNQRDDTKTLSNICFDNLHFTEKNSTSFKQLWPLMEMEQLEMFDRIDQYRLKLEDV